MVQDTPSCSAVASSSCGPAGVDTEMPMPNNVANDDLESDPGFVRYCGRMSVFESELVIPITSYPRGLFEVNHTSENSVKDIFHDLRKVGRQAHGVKCLQRVSNGRFCITFGKKNYRIKFVKKSSFTPHFTNGRPQLSTSLNLV